MHCIVPRGQRLIDLTATELMALGVSFIFFLPFDPLMEAVRFLA
jgi:hypothetical protein